MKRANVVTVTLGVLILAGLAVQAPAQGVTVVKSFRADSDHGYYRAMPDGSGAVGPEHIVTFDGLNVIMHDKATGRILRRMTQVEFWSNVEPANTLVPPQPDSPRMLYDPTSGRWIAVLLSEHKGYQYLAVSTSSDPTKPWKGVQLSKEKQQLLLKIGVDKNGFYMTINSGEDCIVVPKADLIAPGGPDLTNMVVFHNLSLEALPATDFNPAKAPDAPEVLLNKEFGDDCGKLFMYKITWNGKTPSISGQQVIPLSRNYRTRAQVRGLMAAVQPPPGDIIRTDAGRRTDSVYPYGDSVYGVNCARLSDESRQGILWYQVRVSDGKLLQEGYVYDPTCDYFNPTLAVDEDGNVGISCTRSSATEFPSAYVMMHAKGDAPNTMRKPVPAVPGTTYFRVDKAGPLGLDWGRYSVTWIDPSDPRLFWTCQEYAASEAPGQWCTAWAAFKLSPPASAPAVGKPFDVTAYGAVRDGVTDDAPAIQRAINAASAAGGGTVFFPKGTYLLNSAYPSSHPWGFHNLLIKSNVMLLGETGTRLLQGPMGRHPLPDRAEGVRNTMLAFGADHEVIRFQNRAYNGGFFSLQSTQASSTTVTLKTASEASRFLPGDYVAIYQTTSGDVIPTETGQIATVNASTGDLGLKEPLSRSFQTPSIANVTKIVTTNVGVKNLIVEGSEPLTVTETFGFTAEDCQFINDTSIGGKNVIDYNLNTLNGFRFVRNRFTAVGPGYAVMEMTQRNSRHGVWDGNTFDIVQGGMGEYAADIQFTNNTFRLHSNARTNCGLMIGGKDIVFRGNTVSGGNITAGEGWGCILADCIGPGYERYVGNIRIADNTFNCQADGNNCVHLVAPDTSFTGNTLNVKGSAIGIRAEGPLPQSLTIKNNRLSMGTGTGIFMASPRVDGSTVTGNTITGSGAHAIYVASPAKPNSGKHVIYGNTVTGYRAALFIDLALHPGAALSGKE